MIFQFIKVYIYLFLLNNIGSIQRRICSIHSHIIQEDLSFYEIIFLKTINRIAESPEITDRNILARRQIWDTLTTSKSSFFQPFRVPLQSGSLLHLGNLLQWLTKESCLFSHLEFSLELFLCIHSPNSCRLPRF